MMLTQRGSRATGSWPEPRAGQRGPAVPIAPARCHGERRFSVRGGMGGLAMLRACAGGGDYEFRPVPDAPKRDARVEMPGGCWWWVDCCGAPPLLSLAGVVTEISEEPV